MTNLESELVDLLRRCAQHASGCRFQQTIKYLEQRPGGKILGVETSEGFDKTDNRHGCTCGLLEVLARYPDNS